MKLGDSIFLTLKTKNFSVQVALLLFALAACQDLYFFWSGKGWTPFHYESITPLLIIGQTRFVKTSGLAIFLFLTVTKVLFFEFSLDFLSITESTIGIIATGGFVLIATVARLQQWRQLVIGGGIFVIVLFLVLFVDKKLTNNMAASSYLAGLLSAKTKNSTPSNNSIYRDFKDRSIKKKGSILVVWESLGVPLDEQLLATFQSDVAPATLEVMPHEGGSTVTAETRYVCGVNGKLPVNPDCLPSYISSTAMHGNTLSYFSRTSLYRQMDFKSALGRSDLHDLQICHYGYTAVCDDALLDRLLATVKQDECKGFFYVLTIDSHFPYLKYSEHAADLLADVKRFLRKYEDLRVELPDCELIIAGDHPPPLSKGFKEKSVLVIRR